MQENGGCDRVRNEGKMRLRRKMICRRLGVTSRTKTERRKGSDRNERKDFKVNRNLCIVVEVMFVVVFTVLLLLRYKT
jgi:hypothetical protein